MRGLSVRQLAIRLVPLVFVPGLAFVLLPEALGSTSPRSPRARAPAPLFIWYRDQYAKDAKRIIDAHQWSVWASGTHGIAQRWDTNPVEDPHSTFFCSRPPRAATC